MILQYCGRRRRLLYLALTCSAFFTFSLFATNSFLDDGTTTNTNTGVQTTLNRYAMRPPRTLSKGFHIVGANSSGHGVIVQLWPKNSLHLIERAVARAKSLHDEDRPEVKPAQPPKNKDRLVPISKDLVPCSETNYECQRFRAFLHSWPSSKPKAAFYILTQPSRFKHLQNALQSIDTYFNSKFAYPVIIFHEADLVPMIPTIRSITKSELFFQELSFHIPDFLTRPVEENIPCMSPIGYRHMCRFHAKTVFQTPIMRGLDYYWRMDDDSLLLRDIKYDVFQFMRNQNLIYGYSWQHWDSRMCTTGLWNATETYINKTRTETHFFKEWREPQIYYNNFEISDMGLWLSKAYADYIEYIDRLGGMYYHRWGDAPIKAIAVSMFVPKVQVHRFKDVGYQHRSYINK